MPSIEMIDEPPANFPAFIGEVGEGLRELYSEAAMASYRETAPRLVAAAMKHPAVDTFAAMQGHNASGLLMTHRPDASVGQITLLHVLAGQEEAQIEIDLLRAGVENLRSQGASEIVFECISFCPIDVKPTMEVLGFSRVPRRILIARADEVANEDAGESTRAMRADEAGAVAVVLQSAYEDHLDRELHRDVRTVEAAEGLVESVCAGDFGVAREGYVRVIGDADGISGAVLGAEVAPDTGFVVQLVVAPERQGEGLGRGLLAGLAQAFVGRGLSQVALSVSDSNPARAMYERIGFRLGRPFDAYIWRGAAQGE